jgi:hypothetical protein
MQPFQPLFRYFFIRSWELNDRIGSNISNPESVSPRAGANWIPERPKSRQLYRFGPVAFPLSENEHLVGHRTQFFPDGHLSDSSLVLC